MAAFSLPSWQKKQKFPLLEGTPTIGSTPIKDGGWDPGTDIFFAEMYFLGHFFLISPLSVTYM